MDDSGASGWPVSLVIPAFNEAAGIHQALVEANAALQQIAHEYEILVVDDGSEDCTAQRVLEISSSNPHIRLLRHSQNRGYGASLRTGFQAARFDRVAFTDADCQFHLDDLGSLLRLSDEAEIVAGYRIDRQDPWQRRFFSWGYNTLVRTLLGTRVRDCDCALKVFQREALSNVMPQSDAFFVNTEMLARARMLGYEVAEVGVRHRPRLRGASKVSLWDIPRTLRTLLPFWWTQVLFRADDPSAATGPAPEQVTDRSLLNRIAGLMFRDGSALAHFVILAIMSAVLFFSHLGAPLQEPEESRYAEIPRQMLESGNLEVPVLHGLPYYDKPPLLYWLVMGSYKAFGVHDWSARLVSSGAGFFCVLITYFWGRQVVGTQAAFLGGGILCLSGRYVYLGRLLTMNSLLCLCVIAALAAAHLALRGRALRWHWWILSALACGLGVLAKGPVAIVLVGVPALAYQLLDQRAARARLVPWLVFLAAAIGVACPWFFMAARSDPEFLAYFFWKQNLVRYVAPFDHAKPVWYYLGDVVLGMLPWSLLLPGLFKFLSRHSALEAKNRPSSLGFFLLAFAWCLLFYSVSGSKRAGYILPAMPPLALALGWYLQTSLALVLHQGRETVFALRERFAFRATLLVVFCALGGSIAAWATGILRPGTAIPLVVVTAIALGCIFLYGGRISVQKSWALCSLTTFVILVGALHSVLPAYAGRFSMRSQVRRLAELSQAADVPIVSYPREWDSVAFYLGRNDVRIYTAAQRDKLIADLRANPRTIAVIKTEHALDELLRDMPASLEFVPRTRPSNVVVGWVRARPELPFSYIAGR